MEKISLEEARGIAARCWCQQKTQHQIMDPELAEVFAVTLLTHINNAVKQENIVIATNTSWTFLEL